jgi:cyclase
VGGHTIPLSRGGIGDVESAGAVLDAGANRVSIPRGLRKPIIQQWSSGRLQRVTMLSTWIDDACRRLRGLHRRWPDATGTDAIEWAKRVEGFGVQVILPTSKATDGAKTGYDLPLIRAMKGAVSCEIVASGGAGTLEHFYDAAQAGAVVLLAASVFHFRMIEIPALKEYLKARGMRVSEPKRS